MIRVKTAYEKRGDIMIDTLLFKYSACGFIIFERRVFLFSSSENAQQIEEKIEKIEIQGQ